MVTDARVEGDLATGPGLEDEAIVHFLRVCWAITKSLLEKCEEVDVHCGERRRVRAERRLRRGGMASGLWENGAVGVAKRWLLDPVTHQDRAYQEAALEMYQLQNATLLKLDARFDGAKNVLDSTFEMGSHVF
jgi:hypothetical protein